MTHRYMKIGITAVVLVLAFTGMLWSTLREGTEYYKHVDEVMTQPAQWYGKGLQLHGFVVDGTIEKRPDSLDYRFKIKNGDQSVLASYTGTLPDTFKDGSEVVLNTPTEFAILLQSESAKWQALITRVGVKLE